jgi:hypothetical protein
VEELMKVTAARFAALFAFLVLLAAPTALGAIDNDKAVYVGGTLTDFPIGTWGPRGWRTDTFNAEGRINTGADSLVFDAGAKGTVAIPYEAIMSVAFGRTSPFGYYEGSELKGTRQYPRDFFSKDHFLLTIVYRGTADSEQVIIFWLGNDIVRQTLTTLEGHTGKRTRFADAQGCAQYKTREECGFATAGALKGVRSVFVDTAADSETRQQIMSEIGRAKLALDLSDGPDGADVILQFQASRGLLGKPIGLGTIYVRQDQLRIVNEFAEPGRSEKALSTKFAKTFIEMYRGDNR